MSTIQVRIDPKTKKDAQKVLDKVGLDMSSAIKVYFNQIVVTQGIPFQILTENGLTLKKEKDILKASSDAKRGNNVNGPFEDKEAIEFLKKLSKHAN